MKATLFLFALLLPFCLISQENQTIRAFKAEKLYVRGLELYQNGDVRGAIQTFDQVISLDRDHGQVYQAKGDALFELGDYDKAIESYAIAAQQYPGNASLRNSLGVAAAQLGMYRAAESYFLEALQVDPALAAAKRNLERAQLKLREGSNEPSAGYTWDDQPIRPSTTPSFASGTSTVSNGWGEPWDNRPSNNGNFNSNSPYPSNNFSNSTNPTTIYPSNSFPSNNSFPPNDPYPDNSPSGSGWSNSYVTPASPVENNQGATPLERGEPAPPWVRPDRDARKTTFSRDRAEVNVTYRSDPFVHVDQVRITENSTLVAFTVQSISRSPFLIALEAPGTPGALMITDRQFERAYRLKNIRLDGWPNEPYELRPGENKLIIAEFERIPADMYFFHIIEGESPNAGTWDFFDVELVNAAP